MGKSAVFSMLTNKSESRQIFVIDHDANFQDQFDQIITVQKPDRISVVD